jgi:integrase
MSIFKRKLKNGYTWRAVVRIKGYPTLCETFERKQEAEDWEKETKSRIKQGQFKFDQYKKQHTYSDLIDRFIADGALEHHRSAEDTLRYLNYWRKRFGDYALVHITSEFLGKERQLLLETPTHKGKKRTASTVNRYLASLSSSFTYAVKQLRWINESPCLHLMKLKENPGRDRILCDDEIERLLKACRQSRSPYLYCIVLIALTTGARQGEILNLEWQHIDFENRLAYLKETKNGRPRSIALEDPVLTELKSLYQKREPHKTLVFASRTAFGKLDPKKSWNAALKQAGIVGCRFHDMRHTFATYAAREGASNMELKTAMGHRTSEMLNRYTHLDVNVTKRFTRAISDKITGVVNE